MNQINKSDYSEVGYIQKPHGLRGEVILIFDKDSEETFDGIEYFFVEVDGGLVPFYIEDEGLRFKTNETAICRFEFVDSLTKAKNLTGCKLYVLGYDVIESDDQGVASTLVGMRVFDSKFGDIGLISRVNDFSGNMVITVDNPRAEIMIPMSDGIITSLDDDKREIHLNCPNGLIEIYME